MGYAVDINENKLELAGKYGAIAVNSTKGDPVAEIHRLTGKRGVDVALEVIGLPQTMRQAVQSLAIFGRAVVVGVTDQALEIDTYREILGKEAELIGSADHLLHELSLLLEFVRQGRLDLSEVITRTVPLDADAINEAMDELAQYGSNAVRTVITP